MPMNIDEMFQECIRNIEALRDELRDAVLIEVAATAPAPKPEDPHNPANVPVTWVPEGRRFLRRNEIRKRIGAASKDVWRWSNIRPAWDCNGYFGHDENSTYCVPHDWVDPEPNAAPVFANCVEPAPKTRRLLRPDELPPLGRLVLWSKDQKVRHCPSRMDVLNTAYFTYEARYEIARLYREGWRWSDNAEWTPETPIVWRSFEVEG